jgi:hypothetical protein
LITQIVGNKLLGADIKMVLSRNLFLQHIHDIFDRVTLKLFSSESPIFNLNDSMQMSMNNESDGSMPSGE